MTLTYAQKRVKDKLNEMKMGQANSGRPGTRSGKDNEKRRYIGAAMPDIKGQA